MGLYESYDDFPTAGLLFVLFLSLLASSISSPFPSSSPSSSSPISSQTSSSSSSSPSSSSPPSSLSRGCEGLFRSASKNLID